MDNSSFIPELINEKKKFILNTYLKVLLGLTISTVSAYLTMCLLPNIPAASMFSISLIAMISCFIIALSMGFLQKHLNVTMLNLLFILYSIMFGSSLFSILMSYNINTIMAAFLITTISFGLLTLIATKMSIKDETLFYIQTASLVVLLSLIITTLLNQFVFKLSWLDMLLTWIGVVIFVVFIIIDTKRVISTANTFDKKQQTLAAFSLYLDFINLFIRILSIVNRQNRRR